jgi:hypothetical protein
MTLTKLKNQYLQNRDMRGTLFDFVFSDKILWNFLL